MIATEKVQIEIPFCIKENKNSHWFKMKWEREYIPIDKGFSWCILELVMCLRRFYQCHAIGIIKSKSIAWHAKFLQAIALVNTHISTQIHK